MKKILNIEILQGKDTFLKCNYLSLIPLAPNTGRKFLFKDVSIKEDTPLEYRDRIRVVVNCLNKHNQETTLSDFSIVVLDYGETECSEAWVYGLIYDTHEEEYQQGVIDIFNMWQKGLPFNWFSLPINSSEKSDYITACFYYSSVNTDFREKESYQIDFSQVAELNDFLYLASVEFFGDRGYIGHSLHAFEDCLLSIFNKRGTLDDLKLVLSNTDKIQSEMVRSLYESILHVFAKFKLAISTQ